LAFVALAKEAAKEEAQRRRRLNLLFHKGFPFRDQTLPPHGGFQGGSS
jgi:hypothetical protein